MDASLGGLLVIKGGTRRGKEKETLPKSRIQQTHNGDGLCVRKILELWTGAGVKVKPLKLFLNA